MQTDLTFSDVALFGAILTLLVVALASLLALAWRLLSPGYLARLRRLQVARDESTGRLDVQLQLDAPLRKSSRLTFKQRFWDIPGNS